MFCFVMTNIRDHTYLLRCKDVINAYVGKMGVELEQHSFTDVLSCEQWALDMVPRPVLAVLMLYPIKAASEEYKDAEAARIRAEGQILSDRVYYMKQTVSNGEEGKANSLSCLALSCLALSCLALSCLALSCFVFSFFVLPLFDLPALICFDTAMFSLRHGGHPARHRKRPGRRHPHRPRQLFGQILPRDTRNDTR
jgi:hypothetical protein